MAGKRITVEDLWKIERPAQPTLSPDGAQACVSVTALRHEGEQGPHEPVAAVDVRRRAAPAHQRGREGRRAALVARRPLDRLRRASARRTTRAAGLPDRARRRRGAPPHRHRHRRLGDQVVPRFAPPRVRLVGLAGHDAASRQLGEALQGAQGRQGQGARGRALGLPLLGPLDLRRARAAPLHGRRRQRQDARPLRRHAVRAAARRHRRAPLRHLARRRARSRSPTIPPRTSASTTSTTSSRSTCKARRFRTLTAALAALARQPALLARRRAGSRSSPRTCAAARSAPDAHRAHRPRARQACT